MARVKQSKRGTLYKDSDSTFYVPVEKAYCVTQAARTSGWTAEGKEYLKNTVPFCDCLHTIIDRELNDKPYTKEELSAKYKLSSRLFNSAEVLAKGELKSIKTLAKDNWEACKVKLALAVEHHKAAYMADLPKRTILGKWQRVVRWQKKVKKAWIKMIRPSYFPGRSIYEDQHNLSKTEFHTNYFNRRHNRIVSIGEWSEEPCCNSELQVHWVTMIKDHVVTTGYRFKVVHHGKDLCYFNLPRKEGSVLLERLYQNSVEYEWAPKFRKFTTKETDELYRSNPNFIGPLAVLCTAKVRKPYYVPLTVMLLRDPKKANRWQIRVSWFVPKREAYPVTNTFLGYDINNDSIAYTIITLKEGKLEIKECDELFFEAKPNNNKARETELHRILNQIFAKAIEFKACIIGEALNWEKAKLGFSRLSGLLHAIPYKKIKNAVIRKGLKLGVPVRFINPRYTSILGGLLIDQNRDEGASTMITLKGDPQGILILEDLCKEFLTKKLTGEGIPYKIEVKNQSSEIVKIRASSQVVFDLTSTRDRLAPFTTKLSLILSDVTRHWKRLKYLNRKKKAKLSTTICLENISLPLGSRWTPSLNHSKTPVTAESNQCSTLSTNY